MRRRVAGAALALAIMLVPAFLTIGSAQAQTYTYSVLHAFTGTPDGAYPSSYGAGATLDAEGNLYDTTSGGGTYSLGTVFEMNAGGKVTVLYNFTGQADGANPNAGLVRDAQGNLYGTTGYAGISPYPFGWGTLFKLDTAGTVTVLHTFTNNPDSAQPLAGLVQDAQGNLYGTTYYGGVYGSGTVYEVDNTGKETVLYSFTGKTDGYQPYGGVVLDAQGNLYGTTASGGAYGQGTVFKLDTADNETVLYSFCVQGNPCTDGAGPEAALALDAQGNLYGTASGGGALGHGTVFKVDTSDHMTVLYSFAGLPDGASPVASVVLDAEGNLYGTTFDGGNLGCGPWQNCGTVFELATAGSETVLHRFTGTGGDGGNPWAALALDAKGDLFGTTFDGGNLACNSGYGCGTVFELTPAKLTTVVAPTFSPGAGIYTAVQSVTLADTAPGVTICYTTNGSLPAVSAAGVCTAGLTYSSSSPIPVSTSTTIYAVAGGNGYASSSLVRAIYTIDAPAPTFSQAAGIYTTVQSLTLADTAPGVAICYTTNGSSPAVTTAGVCTAGSTYSSAIPVSTSTTIYAVAGGNGYASGSLARAIYTIDAPAPTFSPAAGIYRTAQSVTLADTAPGVTICYTTNGSSPAVSTAGVCTAGLTYSSSSPIPVSTSTTIYAVAGGNGYASSSLVRAIYTID